MNDIFANIGYVLLVINLILLIKGFSANGKAFKIFMVYTSVIFLIQLVTNILYYQHKNNLFLSHFYFVLQFIILSFYYIELLVAAYQKKIVKVAMVLALIALAIQYFLDRTVFARFNLFEIFITSFLLITYAAFHFYNLLNENKRFYYINIGIFVYLFGSTVIFLTGNLVITLSSRSNDIAWTLNSFLYIVYQLFIFYDLRKMTINKYNLNESYSGK